MNQKLFKITLFTALVLVVVLGIMLFDTSQKLKEIEREKELNEMLKKENLAEKADLAAAVEQDFNLSNAQTNESVDSAKLKTTDKLAINKGALKFPTNKSWENRLISRLRSEYNTVLKAEPALGTVIEGDTISFRWSLKQKNDKIFIGVLDYLNNEVFYEEVNGDSYSFSAKSKKLKDGVYYWILESETDVLHASKFILNREKNKS
jgi:hypothetical protein